VEQQGTIKDSVHVCTNVDPAAIYTCRAPPGPPVAVADRSLGPSNNLSSLRPDPQRVCPSRWSFIATSRSKRLQQFITSGRRATLQASFV